MTEYSFSDNGENYSKRTRSSLIRNLGVSFLLGLLVSAYSSTEWGIGLALVMYLIQDSKSDRHDRVFIDKISYDSKVATIDFSDRREIISLTASINEFKFKRKVTYDKWPRTYMAVYYKNELRIKQFEMGEWTKAKMDEVIASFSENQSS